MKKLFPNIVFAGILFSLGIHGGKAQSLSQHVYPSCGGYFTGTHVLSWTIGEPFHTTLANENNILTQGFQQPYFLVKILNLKSFIEGYYSGNGFMQPLLYTAGLTNDQTACDTITVELHEAVSPFNVVVTSQVLLHTDGNAEVLFSSSLINHYYYIVVRHRNSIETWSKAAVLFNASILSFDFTSP
jgi:hypothetical protein